VGPLHESEEGLSPVWAGRFSVDATTRFVCFLVTQHGDLIQQPRCLYSLEGR